MAISPPFIMAVLSVRFLVVGTGVGAYAAALALRRVGHEVLVLEPETEGVLLPGSSRVPPNMSKILYNWGLEDECRRRAVVSRYVVMADYFTGEEWGMHQWDEEILQETGGKFLLMHQTDVRNILKEKAIELGAIVHRDVKIVEFLLDDEKLPGVRLAGGEIVRANIIIGADGRPSTVREMAYDVSDPQEESPFVMFDVTVSIPEILKDPELAEFLGDWENDSTMQCLCGDGHAVLANPVGGAPEYSLHIVTPDDGLFNEYDGGRWLKRVSASRILRAMGPCDPRLQKLVRLSHSRLGAKMLQPFEVEDWAHPEANLILIGGAAHPFPAGAVYSRSMAVEDAACFAEVFSHLTDLSQIPSFLCAFQEIRQPRTDQTWQMEETILHTMTMSPEDAEERAAHIQDALDEGKGAMSNLGYEELVMLFAYDAQDAANDWWVTWGLLKERLQGPLQIVYRPFPNDIDTGGTANSVVAECNA